MTEDETTAELSRRGRRAEIFLTLRAIAVQLTVLGGTVVLARVLDPADFGVYAFATIVLTFFSLFGDAGLGAALIQKKDEPAARELSSVFYFQIVLVGALATVMAMASTHVEVAWSSLSGLWGGDSGHAMPDGMPELVQALSLALFASALRTLPVIQMERELQFGKLAILDVLDTVSYYLAAVPLALLGYGAWALVGAVVIRSTVTTFIAYAMRPYRPALRFDWAALSPMLRFGVTFQTKNVIGFLNGAVTPIYAGTALGARNLGLIQWAMSTAYFPLKLVEIMSRVTFPLLSRFQGNDEMLAMHLGRAIQISALGTFLFVGTVVGIGEPLVVIVYTDQWLPAMPMLYVFTAAISVGFLSPIAAAALDASGRPEVILRLSVGWTILAWVGVLVATPLWGAMGFVCGYVIHVFVGNAAVAYVLHDLVPKLRLWKRIRAALLGGVLTGVVGHFAIAPHIGGLVSLGAGVVASAGIFVAAVVAVDGRDLSWLRGARPGAEGELSPEAPPP